jgi:DNA-binding MarR family transcriptional regulator
VTNERKSGSAADDNLLVGALMDLVGFLNSPQRDDLLLREAGVSLDRALFPLLVRIGAQGPLGVAELAAMVGRDHSTVSRQAAKLDELGLVSRQPHADDRRVTVATITAKGRRIADTLAAARRRLFDRMLADWSAADRANIARLTRKLADAMIAGAAQLEREAD